MKIANIDDGYQRRAAHRAGIRDGRSNDGREGMNKLRSAFEPSTFPSAQKPAIRSPALMMRKSLPAAFQRRTAEAGAQIGNDRAAVFEECDSRDGRRTKAEGEWSGRAPTTEDTASFHTPYRTPQQEMMRRFLIGFV